MKKMLIVSLIINILLVGLLVSMWNCKVSWEHNGKMWSYTLGGFYTDQFRGE